MAPHVLEGSALTLVVLAVEELGGHENLLSVVEAVGARLIGRVVVGVDVAKVAPGMHYMAALYVEFGK